MSRPNASPLPTSSNFPNFSLINKKKYKKKNMKKEDENTDNWIWVERRGRKVVGSRLYIRPSVCVSPPLPLLTIYNLIT